MGEEERGGEERVSAAGNDVEEGKEAECGGVGAVSREAGTATRPRPRSNPAVVAAMFAGFLVDERCLAVSNPSHRRRSPP